jgi:hypothetical protein
MHILENKNNARAKNFGTDKSNNLSRLQTSLKTPTNWHASQKMQPFGIGVFVGTMAACGQAYEEAKWNSTI